METVKLLGISFRSTQHLWWFCWTIGILALSIVAFVTDIPTKRSGGLLSLYCFLGTLSLFISIMAAVAQKTKWGVFNGPIWSIDCIWYNGLLAVIYFLGAALCWRL